MTPHFMLPMLTAIVGGMHEDTSSTDSLTLKMTTAIYTETLKELEHITQTPKAEITHYAKQASYYISI
jgi:hypothetical protein